jgi:amino acid adenylation domain-containing protein
MKTVDDMFVALFCDACEKYSEHIAIICEDIKMSYKDLSRRSSQILDALSRQGAKENDIVAVMLNRTTDVIATMVAILRMGAAFLPIDTAFPIERIKYILKDSKSKILIVEKEMSFIDFEGKILEIDKMEETYNDSNMERRDTSGDLAYVIYTSGSTGYPKGVMISNRAFAAFIRAISLEIDFHPGKKILAVTTISFDIAMLEMLVPLTKGMTVVLANERIIQNSRMLIDYIKRNAIDMIQMTPTRMLLLLESTKGHNWMLQLSDILIGGEPFSKKLLLALKSKTEANIYNLYGPTEATIWVSVCNLTKQEKISIGKPFSESTMIICNEKLIQVENGIIGEICIGGPQLATGYIGRDDLTKEKLYRTGDIGKVNESGRLECLGRIDDQVKIRGYRVELNEISEILLKHEKIKQAVVITKTGKNNNTYLAAYYEGREKVPTSELREYLKKFVLSYMIPDEFIRVEKFPETLNHKIDKKQLSML